MFLKKENVIRMGNPPLRLEILTTIDGVIFETCFQNKIQVLIDEVNVNFISKEDLIINKKASGRYRDLDDLEKL